MRDTVFVFARAPRLGAVKRRLAREIGARAALDFHRATMLGLLRGLAAERRVRTVLAVTPDGARFPLPVRVGRVGQGGGDLGARMQRAAARVRHGRVVIIGCDIPDARAADVVAAFRALGWAEAVFGPAEDGGYWLVGFSSRRPARPFASVRWSTAHALGDTLVNFRGRRVAFLRTLRDVDTAADLRRVCGARTVEQRAGRLATPSRAGDSRGPLNQSGRVVPATQDDLFAFLDSLGIEHSTVTHPPFFTVEEGRPWHDKIPGLHCKNLFIKDRKGGIWHVVLPADKRADLGALEKSLGASRFSFARPEVLLEVLQLTPGSVTPFGLINDTARRANVVLDQDMLASEWVNFHPLTNDASTTVRAADLVRFVRSLGYEPVIMTVPERPAVPE